MASKGFEPTYTVHPGSKTEEVVVNLVFWFCYALGVDLWPRQSLRTTIEPVVLFRCFVWLCLAITAIGNTVLYTLNLGDAPSSLEVVDLLYFVNSMLILSGTQYSFYKDREFLKEFFRENRRFMNRKLLLLIVVNAIYIILDISDAIQKETLLATVARSASVVAWELQTLFLLLLAACIWIVIGQLEELRLTKGVNRQVQAHKNAIRENVRKINQIFGTGLFLVHLKVFSLTYLVIGGMLSSKSVWRALLEVICPLNQVLSLYFIAVLGSRVTTLCHRTASEFLESKEISRIEDPVRTYLNLKHVAARDDIRILDAFSLKNGSFITFCGTVLTFIGVLAQFDYKVVNLLESSKQQLRAAEKPGS